VRVHPVALQEWAGIQHLDRRRSTSPPGHRQLDARKSLSLLAFVARHHHDSVAALELARTLLMSGQASVAKEVGQSRAQKRGNQDMHIIYDLEFDLDSFLNEMEQRQLARKRMQKDRQEARRPMQEQTRGEDELER
jgi:hypothetical protein